MKKRDTTHARLVRLARQCVSEETQTDENGVTWFLIRRHDIGQFAFRRHGLVSKSARRGFVRMIEDALKG